MPLATPARYAEILDAAKAGGYAIPAVNVSPSTTLHAAILSFVSAGEACHQLGSAGRSLTAHAPRPRA